MKKLPSKNMFLIILLGGGVVAFVLLSIFPNYIAYSNINHEIEELEVQIEEQKILSPIFEDLRDKARFEKPQDLPFPEKEALPKNETGRISLIIQNVVQKNGFALDRIVTDMSSLAAESETLKMSVYMIGDFMQLRPVLLQLGALPYLSHIETIQIERFDGRNKVMLALWIAREQ